MYLIKNTYSNKVHHIILNYLKKKKILAVINFNNGDNQATIFAW